MKKIIFVAFILTGLCLHSTGQSFNEQYNALCDKKDTAGQRKLLVKWKKAKPNDPQRYVAAYNYYVLISRIEMLDLGGKLHENKDLKILDNDTITDEILRGAPPAAEYKKELLDIGYAYIDTGIRKFPARLDMRLGKIYMLGKTKDYENFTTEIVSAIDYSNSIKSKWTWTNNVPLKEDGKEFLLGSVQKYVLQLYNANNDSLIDNMKRISEAVLKYFPDHVESLTNLGITYMLYGDFDNALVPLLKAASVAPQDYVVLGDIARCYTEKKNKQEAIKYYELAAKYGDEEAKRNANEKLDELRKQ